MHLPVARTNDGQVHTGWMVRCLEDGELAKPPDERLGILDASADVDDACKTIGVEFVLHREGKNATPCGLRQAGLAGVKNAMS